MGGEVVYTQHRMATLERPRETPFSPTAGSVLANIVVTSSCVRQAATFCRGVCLSLSPLLFFPVGEESRNSREKYTPVSSRVRYFHAAKCDNSPTE